MRTIHFLFVGMIVFLNFHSEVAGQRGIRNNGAKMIVGSGATMFIDGGSTAGFTNNSSGSNHGRLDLDGTIRLEGNWTNNALSGQVLINRDVDGLVLFNGSSAQTIGGSGENYFEDVEINNFSGISMGNNINVNGLMEITGGRITLNNYNFSFSNTGTCTGSYGTSRMFVTNGTGEVRKYFASTGSFDFPIGEITGVTEYTPASFSLTGHSGLSNAYVGVRVIDAKHPENTSPSEYLTRYFVFSSSGITNPVYNSYLYYTNADIIGSESSIYSARFNGTTRTLLNLVDAVNNRMSLTGQTLFGENTGVDGTAPSVAITSSESNPTNSSPFSIEIAFSEEVSGFTISDIVVSNATKSNLTTLDNIVFTLDLTPTADGTITVDVASAIAKDLAGNNNTAATQFSIDYDGTHPTVSLSTGEASPTNESTFIVDIDFSESISGFSLTDITVVNANVANLTAISAGLSYTVEVSPISNGTFTIDINSGVVNDDAGNTNFASNQLSMVYDNVLPSIALSSTASNPTNLSPFTVNILFNENVSGFALSDIGITNGTGDNLTVIQSNREWTVDITPTTDGLVSIGIAAGVAQDAAGNLNTAATSLTRTFDASSPNVVISSAQSSPTNTNPISVTITFDEHVSAFALSDISLSNGSASNLLTSDSIEFTVDITALSETTIGVSVLANKAFDAAGNGNLASNSFTYSYDNTAPVVSTTNPLDNASGVAVNSNLEITFNENVYISTGNIVIKESSTSNTFETIAIGSGLVSGNGTNVISINPINDFDSETDYYILIDASCLDDEAGNSYPGIANTTTWNFQTADIDAPSIVSLNPLDNAVNVDVNSNLIITFNESVYAATGNVTIYKSSDNSIFEQLAISSPLISGSGSNQITINPNSDFVGETSYYVIVDETALDDNEGNSFAGILSTAAWNFTTEDITAPQVLSFVPADNETDVLVNSNLQIEFSETVVKGTGNLNIYKSSDNGLFEQIPIGSAQITGAGTSTFTINPANTFVSETMYYVLIDNGAIEDNSGNNYAGISNNTDWNFTVEDIISPSVTLATTVSSPSNQSPFSIDIVFSEVITGFSTGDFTLTNATVSNLTSADNINFTADITPDNDGLVSISLGSNVALDLSGNFNTASNSIDVLYDGTAPLVTLSSTEPDPTNNSAFDVSIEFSEEVTGFASTDISLTNATIFALNTSDNIVFTATVNPITDGIVVLSIPTGVANDLAGNSNLASGDFVIEYDGTNPSVAISSTLSSPTNVTPIPIQIDFSEWVSGFELSDISVVNGTPSNLYTTNNINFTADITPASDGDVLIDIASGIALDEANNGNNAATQFSIYFNASSPLVTIASSAPNPTNGSIEISISFTEPVIGLETGDFYTSNCVVSSLLNSDSSFYIATLSAITDGAFEIYLPANSAFDLSSNGNLVSNTYSNVYDATAPQVEILCSEPNPTNNSPFEVIVHFSELVDGFNIEDVSPTNAVLGLFTGIDSVNYSISVTPQSDGLITLDIAGGIAMDFAGNYNLAAETFSIEYNSSFPSVALSTSASNPTNSNPFVANITFSEEIINFDISDILVVNANLSNLQSTDNVEFTVDVAPIDNDMVQLQIPENVVSDLAGNPNTASAPLQLLYDDIEPGLLITTSEGDTTANNIFQANFTFSEYVEGFDALDVNIENATIDNLQTVDNITFTADISPVAQGWIMLSVDADVVQDLAGNYNLESNVLNIYYNPDAIVETQGGFVNIYANKDNLYVEFNSMVIPQGRIKVFATGGQLVLVKEIENKKTNIFKLDGNHSVYFVKLITNDNKTIVKKVIIH